MLARYSESTCNDHELEDRKEEGSESGSGSERMLPPYFSFGYLETSHDYGYLRLAVFVFKLHLLFLFRAKWQDFARMHDAINELLPEPHSLQLPDLSSKLTSLLSAGCSVDDVLRYNLRHTHSVSWSQFIFL